MLKTSKCKVRYPQPRNEILKTVLFGWYVIFLQPVGTHLAITTLLGSVSGLTTLYDLQYRDLFLSLSLFLSSTLSLSLSLSLSLYGDRFPWLITY